MFSKRIGEFALSFCLSLTSLFSVAVPKVHASSGAITSSSGSLAFGLVAPAVIIIALLAIRRKFQSNS